MVQLKCPKCKEQLEIDEIKTDIDNKIAVFCINKDCFYHKQPLIGIDKRTSEIFISEVIL